jgi:hypothetical protein
VILSGRTLYEFEKGKGDFDLPRYRVFGVWVPFVGVYQDRIDATAEAGATDGFIVRTSHSLHLLLDAEPKTFSTYDY